MVEQLENIAKLEINDDEKNKTSRKLASIQIIKELVPHQNSEELNVAKVLGWDVVCFKSDKLKEKDKIIYFEIDSLLPDDKKWSEFAKDKKFRVDTENIKGVISQGLLMPLKIMSEYSLSTDSNDYTEGQDLSDTLKIKKYLYDADEDLPAEETKKFSFPDEYGFSRTEEMRIQSNPELLEKFKGKPYYATLKYDGTSSTYFMDYNDNQEFYICSRNGRRPLNKSDCYTNIAKKYKIKDILAKYKGKYAIQGETFGPKIQQNPLQLKEIDFVVFNVYDIEDQKYLDYQKAIDFCKENKLNFVEVVLEGDSFDFDIDQLKELSKGLYKGTNINREGLVFRLKDNFWKDTEDKASFKIINDDYLMNKK